MDRTESNSAGRTQRSIPGLRTFPHYRKHVNWLLQPQQHETFENKLSCYIHSARLAWHELTEYELLKSRGNPAMLIRQVQERYAITYDEAQRQVKGFFDTHRF